MSISSRERELECARQIPSDNIPLANTRINSVAAVSLLTSRMSVRFTRRTRQKYGLVAYAVIIVASFWYREHIQEAADTMRAGNVRAREVGFETAAQLGTCEHKLATLLEELSTLKERRKDLVLTKNDALMTAQDKLRKCRDMLSQQQDGQNSQLDYDIASMEAQLAGGADATKFMSIEAIASLAGKLAREIWKENLSEERLRNTLIATIAERHDVDVAHLQSLDTDVLIEVYGTPLDDQ
eukprot:m.203746 g.203746  ORF g.203746 m.203746 type:complete len:240 (+) comp14995_c0_seq3:42-761(+)